MSPISAAETVVSATAEEPPSESKLLVRARRGDTSAFEQLMRVHEQQVLRTAGRLLGRREDARDAAQEVFLRLYRHLSRIREENDLRPWLYRVTSNVCRDIARKRNRLPIATMAAEAVDLPAQPGMNPIDELDLERRRQLVQIALELLPEKERAALVMRDIEGLSSEDAGKALGSSAATVRSQVASARSKIRSFCEKAMRGLK